MRYFLIILLVLVSFGLSLFSKLVFCYYSPTEAENQSHIETWPCQENVEIMMFRYGAPLPVFAEAPPNFEVQKSFFFWENVALNIFFFLFFFISIDIFLRKETEKFIFKTFYSLFLTILCWLNIFYLIFVFGALRSFEEVIYMPPDFFDSLSILISLIKIDIAILVLFYLLWRMDFLAKYKLIYVLYSALLLALVAMIIFTVL